MKSKKIVCILYSIVLIGMNVFGFAIFSDYRMTDKIFHKRVVEVQARQQELVMVKRLRHGPFTAVTWVRFPYGA